MNNFSEKDLIDSNLNQTITRNGKSIEVHIYRLPNTSWTLEVVDEFGNSTVYDDEFTNDALALNALLDDIEKDGIDSFIGTSSNNH